MDQGRTAPTVDPLPEFLQDEAESLHDDDVVKGLPEPENRKFYPALDGLRAVAVLMVFCQHYMGLHPSLNWGWTGVDLFFVLSGFLITGILYDTRGTAHRFYNFYMRRTLRIFPLYYAVLLIAVVAAPFLHWVWHPSVLLLPLYLANYSRFLWLGDWMRTPGIIDHLRSSLSLQPPFYYQVGHFWSLCVEEQFYLIWAPVVFFVQDRVRLRNLCLIVCSACLAARIVGAIYLPPAYLDAEILYRATPFRIDALLMGGALALILRGPEMLKLELWLRRLAIALPLGLLLFDLIYKRVIHHYYFPTVGDKGLDTFGFTLIDLFAVSFVYVLLQPSGWIFRLFTFRLLRRLGQVSYGFYIFHDLLHGIYYHVGERVSVYLQLSPKHATALIALVATLAFSFASFRYFESPILRSKDRLTR